MIRATTRCVLKQTERWALSACLLCSCCLIAAPSRADYVYGGTQLSWEWLTDANRAIVVGKVVTCDKAGTFTLQVDEVLKQSGLEVASGQTVSGPTLGRSTFYGEAPILRSAGWPALTDPTTYPGAASKVTHLRPRFARMVSWSVGDRCVVFYASDLRRPLQIINLDKPVNIEVDFLAVDMAGEIVTDAGEVVKRIAARVDASLIDGRAQVQTAGISYTVWKSPLDGDDYYSVLAPPRQTAGHALGPGRVNGPVIGSH
ncbi:MAG TPA: hypothetical protein EYQ75_26000 [Planctomycetaceae bacterium]|nr:hypothetical protein [Planctomycetaceae bacterium]